MKGFAATQDARVGPFPAALHGERFQQLAEERRSNNWKGKHASDLIKKLKFRPSTFKSAFYRYTSFRSLRNWKAPLWHNLLQAEEMVTNTQTPAQLTGTSSRFAGWRIKPRVRNVLKLECKSTTTGCFSSWLRMSYHIKIIKGIKGLAKCWSLLFYFQANRAVTLQL